MAKKIKRLVTIGQVKNLEKYVKSDWWRKIFNANYLRTDADVVANNEITKYEVNFFCRILGIDKKDKILDLCCGQGRHLFNLSKRGYSNLTGVDRSRYLINKARKEDIGNNVLFKEGDARKIPCKTDTFDHVFLVGNSYGYFEDPKEDLEVLNQIKRVLKPGGNVLLDISDGEYLKKNFKRRGWEWIDKNCFVCRERSLSKNGDRLISREIIFHTLKGLMVDQFYAERLYTANEIYKLLEQVGFKSIIINKKIKSLSSRNQDLGMMEKRLIVSGKISKKWNDLRKESKKTRLKKRKIIVLLGDPSISDITKPGALFDEDDFYTISNLKNALANINKYDFSFVDNHKKLLSYALKFLPKCDLVFNLCDEGFNNEPSKELHISSLLEIVGVPYTGGSPQCLAYCYDKSLVRGIAKEMNIPVPNAFVIIPGETNLIEIPIEFPVIVKPNFGDSSFGITKNNVCYDLINLEKAIDMVRSKFGYDKPILIEAFLTGKELSVGILGNPPGSYEVLPVIEEDYSNLPKELPKICGYEAKWDSESPYWKNIRSIEATLQEDVKDFLIFSCIELFKRLGCRDYARMDWRIDDEGTPRLLEVNPNPGWCWDGHLAKMAAISGITYSKLLEKIIDESIKRLFSEK